MKVVVALGGNALGSTPDEQLKLVEKTAKTIVDLVVLGNEVIVTHGNGPQVGVINLAFDYAFSNGSGTPEMPFPECGAMSQGYIGYHLQQAILNEVNKRKINVKCATVVTQVEVDPKDSHFDNPTKPVGMFYKKREALKIEKEKGYTFVSDAGRGYRRVVPSPIPIRIIELDIIKKISNKNTIVIATGGGGIPVIKVGNSYRGVAAVIDKDETSSRLAIDLNADMLIILTAVDKVCINFNKPDMMELNKITVEDAKKYILDGEFAKGSMLPKIEACIKFVESTGHNALITSLDKAHDAIIGKNGTLIVKR